MTAKNYVQNISSGTVTSTSSYSLFVSISSLCNFNKKKMWNMLKGLHDSVILIDCYSDTDDYSRIFLLLPCQSFESGAFIC